MSKGHSDTITEGIRVRVGAMLVPDQSDPERKHWFYAYRVVISNEGTENARLVSRHWVIRNANNDVEEIEGPGVVGEQPELGPGESFEYTSGCPLSTEWGTMEGTYSLTRPDGRTFDAVIGRFFLAPNVAPLELLDH